MRNGRVRRRRKVREKLRAQRRIKEIVWEVCKGNKTDEI